MPFPQLSFASPPLLASATAEGAGSAPRRQQSAFDTMENRFFAEGDELSTPPPAPDGWTETTAVSNRRRRKRALGTWVAVAAAVIAVGAVLVCWRANGKAEPAQAAAQTAPPVIVPPAPRAPVAVATVPQAVAALAVPSAPSMPTAEIARPDSSALRACQRAFAQHQGKTVLASCQRAFAEDPESADVAVMLAKTEFDRGHARQALEWAKITISLDAQRADAYVFLGGAEQAAGHGAAARVAYQRYLQLAPKGRYASELRAILRRL